MTAERFPDVVPADRLKPNDPVSVDPFNPKETPLELLNVTAVRLLLVVPADRLMFVSSVPPTCGRFPRPPAWWSRPRRPPGR